MNLEEITQEGFLTRFAKKTRKVGKVVLPLTLATSIITSKCDCITDPKSNKPPETTIISGPSGTINKRDVKFEWEGKDEDGSIFKFHYTLAKSDTLFIEDAYTTETEKNFTKLSEGNYKFGVAAIDNDEAIDQTPATSSFTIGLQDSIPQPKQEIVLNTASTDQQGITSFIDNQTEEKVTVKVQDQQTKSPINNISIDYLDGKDFKAYYAQDPNKNYFPAVFVYPHNSEKIIELSPVVAKAFINQIIQGEEEHKALYSWKSEVTNAWRDYAYVKTISKDEMLEQREVEYAIFDIAAEFATLVTNYNPIPDDYSFSDFIKLLDGWKYFKDGVIAERWDIYHVKGGSKSYNGKTIQFGAEYLDMIASNIPTLTLNEPKVEGSNVTFTWNGEDKTTYDNLNFFYTSQGFPQKDLTITQGSDPNKEDLTYFYKISKNNTIAFQDSTVDNYKIYKNLEDGDYNLEVLVKDEVGNKSNVVTKNFGINTKELEPSIFRVIQDYDFENDLVYALTFGNNNLFFILGKDFYSDRNYLSRIYQSNLTLTSGEIIYNIDKSLLFVSDLAYHNSRLLLAHWASDEDYSSGKIFDINDKNYSFILKNLWPNEIESDGNNLWCYCYDTSATENNKYKFVKLSNNMSVLEEYPPPGIYKYAGQIEAFVWDGSNFWIASGYDITGNDKKENGRDGYGNNIYKLNSNMQIIKEYDIEGGWNQTINSLAFDGTYFYKCGYFEEKMKITKLKLE